MLAPSAARGGMRASSLRSLASFHSRARAIASSSKVSGERSARSAAISRHCAGSRGEATAPLVEAPQAPDLQTDHEELSVTSPQKYASCNEMFGTQAGSPWES